MSKGLLNKSVGIWWIIVSTNLKEGYMKNLNVYYLRTPLKYNRIDNRILMILKGHWENTGLKILYKHVS